MLDHWVKPLEGQIKINADGGFSHNDRAGGIGVLCKSSEGSFFVGFGDTVSADSPKVVEGLALCKGAEVAAQKRQDKVIIEFEAKLVVDEALKQDRERIQNLRPSLIKLDKLVLELQSVKFQSIKCQSSS